jgi:hypothetical protein
MIYEAAESTAEAGGLLLSPPSPGSQSLPSSISTSTSVTAAGLQPQPRSYSPQPSASLSPQLGGTMTTAATGYEGWSIEELLEEQERLINASSSSAATTLATVEAELRKRL